MFDENFDHRILRGLVSQLPDLDFVVVQYTEFRGAGDPQLLARAAEQNRILITHDLKTIPKSVSNCVYGRHGVGLVSNLPTALASTLSRGDHGAGWKPAPHHLLPNLP
ncbi:MAG: DUF5615 family PIN-like protein, partial [Acidobacteria bacterium]|nr:DUF5615 family PIN-like protein [Acidobacteriota bacterium]